MRYHHDYLRLVLLAESVHVFLHKRYERLELQPAVGAFVHQCRIVSIGIAENRHLHPVLFHDGAGLEISLAAVSPDHISGEERNALFTECLRSPVIDSVAGLEIAMSCCHGIVFHICCEARVKVRGQCIGIIIVERGVAPEKIVAGIHEDDIVRPLFRAQLIDILALGHQRTPCGALLGEWLGKPGAVAVSGSDK